MMSYFLLRDFWLQRYGRFPKSTVNHPALSLKLNTAHHPETPYLSVSEDTIYFVAHFIPHVEWISVGSKG